MCFFHNVVFKVKILADTMHVELHHHVGASIVGSDIAGRSVVIYFPTDSAAQEGFQLFTSRIRNVGRALTENENFLAVVRRRFIYNDDFQERSVVLYGQAKLR